MVFERSQLPTVFISISLAQGQLDGETEIESLCCSHKRPEYSGIHFDSKSRILFTVITLVSRIIRTVFLEFIVVKFNIC